MIIATLVIGPSGRPLAQDLQIVAIVSAIETIALWRWGSTLGMRVLRIRVAVLGRAGRPSLLMAARRSVPIAWCYAIMVPGMFVAIILPWALLWSIARSPHRRGFHDRLSETIVVQQSAPAEVREADLDTWWEPGVSVVMSPWGRVPDLFDRRRARAHRFDGEWWQAALIACCAVASVGMTEIPWLWLWLTLVWMVAAIIDESWWIFHHGATPGHRHSGYRIVDVTTGESPTLRRSVLRSVICAPFLYIPPLQLILGLWVHASALHRGPHDLAARTVVVEPDYQSPSFIAIAPSGPGTFATPYFDPYRAYQRVDHGVPAGAQPIQGVPPWHTPRIPPVTSTAPGPTPDPTSHGSSTPGPF